MIGLFHLLNEAVLRLLAGFFELEKPLAKLGLEIYKNFADQTKRVTGFFEQAGRVSMEIGVRIPVFKQVSFHSMLFFSQRGNIVFVFLFIGSSFTRKYFVRPHKSSKL